MSRSRWLRISLAAALVASSCVLVRGWQKEESSENDLFVAQTGAPERAAGQPAGQPDTANEGAKRQSLLAEWSLRKREEATNAAEIYRALRSKTKLDVKEMALEDVLAKLAEDHNLQILIDKATLTDEGVSLETPITLSISDITLRSALKLVLEPCQLTTIIRHEVLRVTTTTKAADDLDTRMYDVRRIVERKDFNTLVNVITTTIEPDTWDDNGGPGSVKAVAISEALAIRQTQQVHERIATLLEQLEQQLAVPVGGAAAAPLPDANREAERAIHAKLAMRCNLKCKDETFEHVLERIAREHQVPMWVDRPTLTDEGVSTETPINLDLKAVRLQSALEALLEPMQLTWVIDDEVLKITTTTKAADRLATRIYDVRDLQSKREVPWPPAPSRAGAGGTAGVMGGMGGGVGGGGMGMFDVPVEILKQGFGGAGGIAGMAAQPQPRGPHASLSELIDLIMTTVHPDTWDDNGGPGAVVAFRGLLVVRQTANVHGDIGALLNDVRMFALRKQLEAPKPAPEDPNELMLFVYRIDDYPVAELEKLIPEVISPESWKSEGGKGTLVSQPSSLVIRQTPAVHKEVVKLLYKIIEGTDLP